MVIAWTTAVWCVPVVQHEQCPSWNWQSQNTMQYVNISVPRSSSIHRPVHWTFALSSGRPALCSATNHHKQNSRAVSFHIIAQPENVHYALVFLGIRTRTLNHERKAVWEVQMVLSLTPQHSDHSQGACTYRQCRPFLPWRRWHRKKRGLLCKHQKQTHKQRWPSESPIHLFSCWALVVPGRSRRFHWTDGFMLLCTLILGNSWNVNGNFSKCYISSSFCFGFILV